ncbi:efflux RND transporter periplasmic adaptor subunit [Mucilaginibacter lappiensis]|uniref:efflux RND transporter periplasmic adaptor subunit n=1 Tax=Mucilaginibacter lappiensis TaxID=354630 RepID=UPI003D22713A
MQNPSKQSLLAGYRPNRRTLSLSPIIVLLLASSCGQQPPAAATPPPPALSVIALKASNDTTYQEYPASIEGTVNIEIRPQVSGTLAQVYVDEGAFVSAGTTIFKIDDQPFRSALNNAIATQHAAEGALTNAQLEVEKLMPLVQNKVVSDFQLRSAKAAYEVAKGNIEQAKANVETARINLGYTTIKAPISGYLGRLTRKKGSLVSPADPTPLTQLSDVSQVHAYFSLGEDDFIKFKELHPGGSLKEKLSKIPPVDLLLADGTVYPIKGRIDMIDGQFDKTTGAITGRVVFNNPKGLLRSGNTGTVRLSLVHTSVISIPQSATMDLQDKIFVFELADSNKVKKQMITVFGKSGGNYLVKDGLQAGQKIVLSGMDRLQEGMVIQPQIQSKATPKPVN